ncbi:hypothetical protein CAEBREN_24790 [Caenorhabditis brenneri]|uniref:Uncharacterized protein n=1 Tax=Caenorhabditis brenneri TaxID=135651 RepID=G0NWM2_CAEBE|nr:hypothetical protein CAEBREN_24790 [Caenorhabditis brenneri]
MSDDASKDVPGPSINFEIEDGYVMNEPSPLDRILADGRSYNAGDWTSEELSNFYTGISKYGTRPEAVSYIHRNLVKNRTEQEIKTKIDEIREIIKEHKEIILPDAYKKKWIQTGYRNIGPPEDCDVNPNEDWCNIICKVVDKHQASITKNFNPTREAIEQVFEKFAAEAKTMENAKVTNMQTARASPNERQHIRWPQIYKFMQACAGIEDQMPPLNELEAAIVAKVLDAIGDEAASMPDAEKSIMAGLFNEIQLGDFRHTEQDFPPSLIGGVQLFVDPLRTRFYGVPEVGAEVSMDLETERETDAPQDP